MPEPVQIGIVGGGVAGLATAVDLEAAATARGLPVAITLFEAAPQPGGNVRSIHDEGYCLEVGPNGFLDSEPATLRMVSRLGLGDALQRSFDASRRRFLLIDGRIVEMPFSPPAFILSRLLTLPGKLRVAAEVLIPARRDLGRADVDPSTDETVYDFGKRRLGKEFAERLLDPMVKGIFGGDARRLSLAAAFPRMVELERDYGSLFVALRKLSRAHRGKHGEKVTPAPRGVLHSFAGGMETLSARLASTLSGRLLTSTPVERIAHGEHGWQIEAGGRNHGPFAAVVEAAPAHAAAQHLADTPLGPLLREIPYAPMVDITLAFDRGNVGHGLNGFGMLIPSRERRRLLGVLWSAGIFPNRAPGGKVVLRCMAGGPGREELLARSDEDLERICLEELADLYRLRGRPERRWVLRHPKAIAQYEPGHLARLRTLDGLLAERPGLFLTGSSYRGISVNNCMKEAERVTDSVLDHLTAERPSPAPSVRSSSVLEP